MSKKVKMKKKQEEEIIIGYNSKQIKDKPRKNKRKEKNKLRRVKKVLFTILKTILILIILAGIGAFLFISPVFNITEIKVENASKISQNTYISLSDIKTGENIFRIDKSKSREMIKSESYVEDVEIKRVLPSTIILTVTERTPKYMIERNDGMYMYIDKNGYYLEARIEKLDIPILRGIATKKEELKQGDRILEEDLEKFNDLIKIIDGIKNNNIETTLSIIDISDHNNYILEFTSAKKKVMLGDISNLSTKMIWMKYLIEEEADKKGTIHLNSKDVYFSPEGEDN